MSDVRPSHTAGIFYPADPLQLRAMLESFGHRDLSNTYETKALIVPHAGYEASGAICASGYNSISNWEDIHRVVLLGPSHKLHFHGLALTTATALATPLGALHVDGVLSERLTKLPQVHYLDVAHSEEFSLEVQLPFLQEKLGPEATVLPIIVGQASLDEILQVLALVWGGPETLVVVSSDLSRHLPYREASARDESTREKIKHCQGNQIDEGDACGYHIIAALLQMAKKERLKVHSLDVCNSGDTVGESGAVVGFGAFVVS